VRSATSARDRSTKRSRETPICHCAALPIPPMVAGAKGAKQAACAPPPADDPSLCAFCTESLYVGEKSEELREDAGACRVCLARVVCAYWRRGEGVSRRQRSALGHTHSLVPPVELTCSNAALGTCGDLKRRYHAECCRQFFARTAGQAVRALTELFALPLLSPPQLRRSSRTPRTAGARSG
jgi:hypothetical protein